MGIAGEQRAVAVVHGDRGIWAESDGGKEGLEIGGLDAAAGDTEELAARPRQLANDNRGPRACDPAVHRLDQHVGRARITFEKPEVGPIRNIDGRNRPDCRGIDQLAIGVEQVEGADVGQRADSRLQHRVDVLTRHPLPESFRAVDPGGADKT